MTESGRLCAFITKVKKGSLADTVGHLRPGDQVLEWNGRALQGASFNEVYNIILDSKAEPQVELLVCRPLGEVSRSADISQLESSSFDCQKVSPSPISPGVLSGPVSVRLWYDKVGQQLIVTVLGAKELPVRDDGRPRNPYVNIYLLPDRSDKSKRRTKTVKKSVEPRWNQTFMYSPVPQREFRDWMLELTVWDQARVREEENQFLGESPDPNDFLSPQRLASPLTASQLAVVLSSLCHGVPEACRLHRGTTPLAVRQLALQQRRHLWDRKWFWRTEKLAEWVLGQREQQLSLSEDALLRTARTALGEDAEPAERYSWAADFMLRHELAAENGERRRRGRLPRSLRDNCRSFIRSLSTQIQTRGVLPRCVGAMDEFSVFIDADRFSAQDPSALRLSGAPEDEPAVDVVLSALSDGTLLPPLLFFRGAAARLPDGFPDNVLLQARREGFKDSERLETWFHQVWRPRVVSQGNAERVLLLDVHRGHVTDAFRDSLTSASTGMAFIPPGCCCRLQPLNICLTPVLTHFLQARWTQLVSDGGLDGLGLDQLALTLACWLSEVSSTLNSETHILRRSFASVCSEQPVEDDDEAASMIAALSAALVQPPDASKPHQEAAEPQLELLVVMEEEGGVEEVVMEEEEEEKEEEEEEESALHQEFYGDSDNEPFLGFIDD
ncbi:hypothetical protein PFLUV_G00161590 [Perca fluviatilis]|uniref:PDZ domain-containing protein n=1 Tax=Perca fluviatilis TaxID=8168 RepID=A0A6A5F441_PERFL|nr:hypothetical protein PFLUV_G00161590 [Perca fluviatilis]